MADQAPGACEAHTPTLRAIPRKGHANEINPDPAASSRHLFRDPRWHIHDYWFGKTLGELRAGVSLQVATFAASYGLDVEDDLARTLALLGAAAPSRRRGCGRM